MATCLFVSVAQQPTRKTRFVGVPSQVQTRSNNPRIDLREVLQPIVLDVFKPWFPVDVPLDQF